jgi:hydroxymethylbilane synthase
VQLLSVRPDLEILPVRGNVQTRLSRAGVQRDGVYMDAVVLALAGLRRLGLEQHVTEVLPIELSLPAAGQGAIAIEALRGSAGFAAAAELDDAATARCVQAERAVLQALAGSCTVPIAAYAIEEAGELWLRAALGGPDGEGKVRLLRAEARGSEPRLLGASVAEQLLALGGGPLLSAARSGPGLPPPPTPIIK